ncbi:nuclear exosome regulator NRDE2-like isoform X1 [Octopus sinensis]|uniref:Nuclear exosome regulator NRDE2-like isoform X1 n=1 Tax=Octopus sinensis TaxID=2607531 RepID=A0A6P7S4A2_9MOLL|nr:nuclear exosome regulator NRDE2-like isoform X1 [Octopus sinensis]
MADDGTANTSNTLASTVPVACQGSSQGYQMPSTETDSSKTTTKLTTTDQNPSPAPGLFPAYSVQSDIALEASHGKSSDLSWLSNKSFPNELAANNSTLPSVSSIAEESSDEGSSGFSSTDDDEDYDDEDDKGEKSEEKDAKDTKNSTEDCKIKVEHVLGDEDQNKDGDSKKNSSHQNTENSHSLKRKHKSKKHKHSKKYKKLKYGKTDKYGKNLAELYKGIPGQIFLGDNVKPSLENIFRIDCKADTNIWTYGSIYKLHVAKYFQCCKFCLGLTDDNARCLLINRTTPSSSETKKLVTKRYFDADSLKQMISPSQKTQLCQNVKQTSELLDKNVISLTDDNVNSGHNNPGHLDVALNQQVSDTNTDGENNISIATSSPVLEKVAYYNKRLHSESHNVSLWLEFVSFQETFLEKHGKMMFDDNVQLLSFRGVLEKKVAILDKAIEFNPHSIDLKVARLKLCHDLWEPNKVQESWEKLLSKHSTDSTLWKNYLLQRQCNLTTFSVLKVTKLYHKCFKCLLEAQNSESCSQILKNTLNKNLLDIFVQYCCFLLQTGFTEKMVASLQAVLEFNLFCPTSLEKSSTEDRIAVYESFWDSGVARFGEPGAEGWKSWVETKSCTKDTSYRSVSIDDIEEDIISQNKPQWQTWLNIEQLRESVHWLPWRPDTSADETLEDCEDLDRLVLFDDIAPVLIQFDDDRLKLMLLIHSLYLLGVYRNEQHFLLLTFLQKWFISPFTLIDVPQAAVLEIGLTFELLSGNKARHELFQKFVDNIFQQAVKVFSGENQTAITLLWLEHHLSLLRKSPSGADKTSSKDIHKFAKSLLKENHNRNNLILWNAFARLEWELGRKEEAFNVIETVLVMQGTDLLQIKDPWEGAGICALYHTYIDILLDLKTDSLPPCSSKECSSQDLDKSRWALIHLAEGTKLNVKNYILNTISPTMVLKTRKKFDEISERLWGQFQQSTHDKLTSICYFHTEFLECFALFEYCFNRLSAVVSLLDSVQNQFEHYLKKSERGIHTQELPFLESPAEKQIILHCDRIAVKLSLYHMSHHHLALGSLKQLIKKATERHPSHPYFLKILVHIEQSSWLMGNLRRYFDRCLLSSTLASPVLLLFALSYELEHQNKLEKQASVDGVVCATSGTLHRLRSLFERGLNQPQICNCPLIWRLYLYIEHKYGEAERATGLYYRALQHCPWAKALYKDAIAMLGDSKLQDIVDLMLEKEMRIQIPIEEIAILRGDENIIPDITISEENPSDPPKE